MIINVNEEIVNMRMPVLLKEYDCCKCDKCVGDMTAIALNNIKPAYVNTEQGVLFKRVNSMLPQVTQDIDIVILKAINMVSSNPQHPPKKAEEPAPKAEEPAPKAAEKAAAAEAAEAAAETPETPAEEAKGSEGSDVEQSSLF